MNTSFKNLLLDFRQGILILTINRETKLNALDRETLAEIHRAFAYIQEEPSVKGVIITGAGSRAFVAGADIAELQTLSPAEATQLAEEWQEKVFNFIENSPKPVIAAINGFALGGGLELALAAHLRVATADAKLGLPEVSLGLIPGYGGTQRLSKLVGKGRAMEVILTGEMISAQSAAQMGLVNAVCETESVVAEAENLLLRILKNSPVAIRSAINAINAAGTEDGFATEIQAFGGCFGTEDFQEGVSAFLNKRKARFK